LAIFTLDPPQTTPVNIDLTIFIWFRSDILSGWWALVYVHIF
jgi:hypothetical protein